ncbi:MAG TPA: D-glycero-beta-D-manno-heptose-7-phosphate kinase [Alphaproteobacteria bacterium]|nr:D-glycero-beta-D-manno-heptose-7-phosphate kinase [Alphaproteobacteria bacterium]
MSDGIALHAILDRFPGARILCVGDVMLDRFVYGRVERVSAEAPIPILRVERQFAMLGGVGNVARNVVALDGQVTLVAAVGDDATGREIEALAAAEPRLTARLVRDATRSSTLKARYLAAGQQLLRADEESSGPLAPAAAAELVEQVKGALPDCDVVVLSDYAKGVLSADLLADVIAAAQAAAKPVVADPKRPDLSAYAGVQVLTPNQAELALATGLPCGSDDEVVEAARQVMDGSDIAALLVTRSEHGASLVAHEGAVAHLPARALEVFDVSGAGDTVVATLALALGASATLEAAAYLANAAAGLVVGKVGTAVVGRDELGAALLSAEVHESERKVASRERAAEIVAAWQARGLKVGFTNGCFDLLHPGHLLLLREARAACDRLVVAINSDASVKRLKGPDRPVQDEAARAIVLAGLQVVDLVVVFDEDTPVPLLERLRPDVLLKGGDYTVDQVVGAEVVRAYGGEVRVTGHMAGHGSSRLIARMAASPGKVAD